MIDAWLVDLDGTLYRPRPLKLVMALQLALRGRRAIPVIREFRRQHERVREELEDIAASSPFEAQVEYTARALDMSPAAVRPIVEEWMIHRPCSHLRRFRRTELLDEIRAFREGGGRTAVVSDYPALDKLAALEAAHLFDAVIANGETNGPRKLKPDPEGYLSAADRLDTPPERCLVIGDRDDTDGAAASAAGMAFRLIR